MIHPYFLFNLYQLGRVFSEVSSWPITIVFVCLFFRPHHAACGILVPRPGIEPVLPAVEVWSPNYWTVREVPIMIVLNPTGQGILVLPNAKSVCLGTAVITTVRT